MFHREDCIKLILEQQKEGETDWILSPETKVLQGYRDIFMFAPERDCHQTLELTTAIFPEIDVITHVLRVNSCTISIIWTQVYVLG